MIERINPLNYRGFYLIIADKNNVFVMESDEKQLQITELEPGLHMITSRGIDNVDGCPRVKRHLDTFKNATLPDPLQGNWKDWIDILSCKAKDNEKDAMTIIADKGFGTVSSSLVAIGKDNSDNKFLFASGRPSEVSYEDVIALNSKSYSRLSMLARQLNANKTSSQKLEINNFTPSDNKGLLNLPTSKQLKEDQSPFVDQVSKKVASKTMYPRL